MLSRTLRTAGKRFYSDKPAFSVESFVNRIDALAKNRSTGGKKRWEISGKKPEGQQQQQNQRPRRPQQPRTVNANGAPQKAGRPRPSTSRSASAQSGERRAAGSTTAPKEARTTTPKEARPVETKPAAVGANHADSFAQPAFSVFTPVASKQGAKPLTKRRQPFDRRRARKPTSGRSRPAVRARPNKSAALRASRAAEVEQGVLSGSQALDIVLRSAGSDTTGCISVDRLDVRSITSSLVPSSVTYNTRVWSVLNQKNVSGKDVAQLVEEAVQGRISDLNASDPAVANALASNRYLDSNTRVFLSKVAAGKIPLNQIAQR